MWPLAVLTRVFYKKMYGRFVGQKTVVVITRRPYYQGGRKAGLHCTSKSLL